MLYSFVILVSSCFSAQCAIQPARFYQPTYGRPQPPSIRPPNQGYSWQNQDSVGSSNGYPLPLGMAAMRGYGVPPAPLMPPRQNGYNFKKQPVGPPRTGVQPPLQSSDVYRPKIFPPGISMSGAYMGLQGPPVTKFGSSASSGGGWGSSGSWSSSGGYVGPPGHQPFANGLNGVFSGRAAHGNNAQSEGECTFDEKCWKVQPQCAIANAVMFDRMTGSTCEECLQECVNNQSPSSPYICRSVTYDHRWQICDLFAIDGQQGLQFLTSYPGRDYFMLKNIGVGACNVASARFKASISESVHEENIRKFNESKASSFKHTDKGTEKSGLDDRCKENEVARFCKRLRSDVKQSPEKIVEVSSEQECIDQCFIDQRNRGCSSFVYDQRSSCKLYSINTKTGAKVIEKFGRKSYYEKVCLPAHLARDTDLVWEMYKNYVLLGHVQEVTDASSLEQCKIHCLKARDDFSFECKSVMYYTEDIGQNCLLNSETRISKWADFLPEETGSEVVYFDVGRSSFKRKFKDSVLDVDRITGQQWTLWTDCKMAKNEVSYRYLKCHQKDIRNCRNARKRCPTSTNYLLYDHFNKISNSEKTVKAKVSKSPCIAIRGRDGFKRCPHGFMIRNGRMKYCRRPRDC